MDKIQNINLNQIAKMNDTSQELINKSNQPGDDKTHEEENSKIENYYRMFRGFGFAILFAFFTSISDILIKFV